MKDGRAEVTWSHDGEDTAGGYEAEAWGALPWDYLCVAWWQLGQRQLSLAAARQAVALEPENERLKNNLACLEGSLYNVAE